MLRPGAAGVFDANHVLCALSGYTSRELSSLCLSELMTDGAAFDAIRLGQANGIASSLRCKDGTHALLEWNSTLAADGLVYAVGRDITEHRRIEERLSYVADYEPLTGLQHHQQLENVLALRLDEHAKCWVIFLGLDRYQAVNSLLDHIMGDHVLTLLAERMRGCVGTKGQLSRFMGDQFVVAVTHASRDAVLQLAEQLRAVVSEPIEGTGYRLRVTASVGISHSPDHGTTPRELVRRAEAAMRTAKEEGRDTLREFSSDQMIQLEDRLVLGSHLQAAIGRGELDLHYQPLFAATENRLTGFEALLRWTSPDLGSVSAGRFIPVAEALGLMCDIGNWVLNAACQQARAWLDCGHGDFTLAVNVSAQQLQRPDFPQEVQAALDRHGIPDGLLHIELTESTMMQNVSQGQVKLAELKQLGIAISIDDFGTGYSSLAYLKHFKIDKLKIDQSFVRGLPLDSADVAIAQTIIAMAHQLGMTVTAEGVENAAQREFLIKAGCDELQGYLLGAPTAAAVAAGILASR